MNTSDPGRPIGFLLKGSKVGNITHPLKVSIPTNPYVKQTMKVEIDDDEYHHCMDRLYF